MDEVGRMAVQKKLYTLEEFQDYIRRPENADRLFELIDGEIIEKVPTERHNICVRNILVPLHIFVQPRGLGRAVSETRYQLPGDEHNARIPDVSFTSAGRLLPVVEEGAVPLIPDLCIEVQSPDDSPKQMRDQAAYYLANGARLVWLVYPKKRMVEVLYPNGEFDIFREGETLSGGEVIPGFTLAVRDVFEA
jgi:Uma2 family endonuclease